MVVEPVTARRPLGRTSIEVGPLSFGSAPLATAFWGNEEAVAVATARRALADRADVAVATKVGRSLVDGDAVFDFSAEATRRQLDASLGRPVVIRVDLVHVHDPDDHLDEALAGCVPVLRRLHAEGADYVILGAMYQRSPNGLVWLAETEISSVEDLVGKRIGLTTGDQIRVDALFRVNGLEPDYETVQMSFDPQPLIDGDADVITCYVTNQPIQFELEGIEAESMTNSDFGLKAFGDVLFASKAYVEANRDLLVQYFAALIEGVEANVADPTAVIPLLTDVYGKDAEIDPAYSEAGNPAYIALLDSDYTEANGRLQIDPEYLEAEVYASYEAAGETDLPPVSELLDATVMADAHAAL